MFLIIQVPLGERRGHYPATGGEPCRRIAAAAAALVAGPPGWRARLPHQALPGVLLQVGLVLVGRRSARAGAQRGTLRRGQDGEAEAHGKV